MSYHNIRDKFGRFKPVSRRKRTAPKKKRKEYGRKTKEILNVFVLDDTSSMLGKEGATMAGFNEMLAGIRADEKVNKVKNHEQLVIFGASAGNLSWNYDVHPLQNTHPAQNGYYYPRQTRTALYDTIVTVLNRVANDLILKVNPNIKVVVTVFTDGIDNVYNTTVMEVNQRINQAVATGWVVNFIGAGSKAHIDRMADMMGVPTGNRMAYENNAKGTRSAFVGFTTANSNYSTAVADGVDDNIGFFSK